MPASWGGSTWDQLRARSLSSHNHPLHFIPPPPPTTVTTAAAAAAATNTEMMKFWPSSPPVLDLATPRASSSANGQVDRNPFDALPQSPKLAGSPGQNGSHHPLLTPTKVALPSGSPFGPTLPSSATADRTPLASPTATAYPTTSLSIHAPVFNSFLPPTNMALNLPKSKLKNQPEQDQPPPSQSSTPSSSSASSNRSSSPAYSPSASLGQIHVKLIEARGLNVTSSAARPYVVVQFEQNEFVSRDPIADGEREVRGTPRPTLGSRQSSAQNVAASSQEKTAAMSALGAIGQKDQARRKGSIGSNGSSGSSTAASSTLNGSLASNASSTSTLFGRLSQNPVWKHEVSL